MLYLKIFIALCVPGAVTGLLWMGLFTITGMVGLVCPGRVDVANRFPARIKGILLAPVITVGSNVVVVSIIMLYAAFYQFLFSLISHH